MYILYTHTHTQEERAEIRDGVDRSLERAMGSQVRYEFLDDSHMGRVMDVLANKDEIYEIYEKHMRCMEAMHAARERETQYVRW